MEDVEILRNLGTPPNVLERYVELRGNSDKQTIYLLNAMVLFLFTSLVFIILFGVGVIKDIFAVILLVSLLFLSITIYLIVLSAKFRGVYFKIEDLERNYWLIDTSGIISKQNIFYTDIYLLAVGAILAIIIIAYLTGDTYMSLFSLIFLLIIPIVKISSKKAREIGYTIEHLFPDNVDEIAEKIEKALGGKKVMVIKYKNSRSYKIDLKSQSNLKLYVSRYPKRKEFTTVEIIGVKNENLSEVVKLISQINKILT